MLNDIMPTADVASRAFDEPPLSKASAMLERTTRADAVLAFKDAVADYARIPNASNERRVEAALRVLRHHRQHVPMPSLAQALGA